MNPIPQSVVGYYKNALHFLVSLTEIIRYCYPARKLKVIGITGTDGKTTTAHLIYEILKKAGKKAALVSTIGAFIGDELIDTGYHVTNPDATVLQPLLKRMAKRGMEYVVLEATSHGLDQHRVLGCNFLVGVLTNLTHEHLDYHKTFEKYKAAKRKLFRGVKYAVLNRDDPSFDWFAAGIKKGVQIISYSLEKDATLRAGATKQTKDGMDFNIKENGRTFRVATSLLGKYNISNILAAAGAARALEIGWREIKKAVEEFGNITGRMQEISLGQPFRVIVDFAHTPNGLKNLLETLLGTKQKTSRLITVIGSAGERDVGKRPMLGEVATKLSDVTIFTAEDPRHEDVLKIIGQMAQGAKTTGAIEAIRGDLTNPRAPKKNRYVVEPDRKKAIELAISVARKDDIAAICGKGHEKTMNFNGAEYPWFDKEVAEKILRRLNRRK